MFLKSMEMMGFKSFPDKIDLLFPKGITCVVGPNGSGKSNISDAIRWVMGEQSVKTLRGGKMEDVIFSGTQKRKPLGFCEVNLTVDNSDRALPADFDEIIVSRRMFRSGESEYYINKSSCRLKDIHEMFMDTGLGRDGYSLVGQGKIDEIISGRPSERRMFFEEACGISKYHHRKNEAERKLGHTNDNILRLDDIIAELENQLIPLKTQSEKAKKYLVMRDELRVLEVNVWLLQYEKLKVLADEVSELYSKKKSETDVAAQQLAEADGEIVRLTELQKELQEENDRLNQDIHSQEYNIKTFENQIEIAKNNIGHESRNMERLKSEKKELLKKQDEFALRIKEFEENKLAKLNEIEKYIKITSEKNKELSGVIAAMDLRGEELKALRAAEAELTNRLNVNLAKRTAALSFGENLLEQKNSLTESLEEKIKRAADIERAVESSEGLLSNAREEERRATLTLTQREEQLSAQRERVLAISKKQWEEQEEYTKAKNRHDMLADMESSFSAYPKSVKDVMNANLDGTRLYGTAGSLLRTEEKYSKAVDSALGAAANHIICESQNDAKRGISYLKQQKSGRATFLPISAVRSRGGLHGAIAKEPGYVGDAFSLISCEGRFREIFESLLLKTAVFETMDTAAAAHRKHNYSFKGVTLGGEIFNAGGSITGGEYKNNIGAVARMAEIKTLKDRFTLIEAEMKTTEKELAAEQLKFSEYDEELHNARKGINDIKVRLSELSSNLKYENELLESVRGDIERNQRELSSIAIKLERNGNDIKEIELLIEESRAGIAEKEKEINEKDRRDETDIIKERINSEIASYQMEISRLEQDMKYEQDKIDLTARENENLHESVIRKDEEIAVCLDNIDDLESEMEFRQGQIRDISEELSENRQKVCQNSGDKEKAQADFSEKRQLSIELRDKLIKLKDEDAELSVKMERSQTELHQIIENLWESYELTITTAEELRSDIGPVNKAAKRAAELKSEMKGLGNVNIGAIEEYEAVNKRYTFLTGQRSDLQNAKDELEKIIEEMLKLMKTIFREQFEKIGQSFKETYTELFGGGIARLNLTEPDNVLESGIEIEVQPPGKKLTVLSLLSGGEKAFTAIALLFAILKIRPTPFCLFDEIEAALDDVNVYRFSEYLMRYKENTQFIIITHRRGTMESADTLYGVTMQEKGVSKLLSLNIDEIAKDFK